MCFILGTYQSRLAIDAVQVLRQISLADCNFADSKCYSYSARKIFWYQAVSLNSAFQQATAADYENCSEGECAFLYYETVFDLNDYDLRPVMYARGTFLQRRSCIGQSCARLCVCVFVCARVRGIVTWEKLWPRSLWMVIVSSCLN